MDAIPTIAEAARQIAAKELSPVELTKACLDRVKALDNRLHAFYRQKRRDTNADRDHRPGL